MTSLSTDWANRWLGGFCALGAVGGLPVRGPDYAAHPALDQMLTLPSSATTGQPPPTTDAVLAAWSDALGGVPVVLVRNVERARAVLLQAAGVQTGEPVALPANATRPLVEAVKHHSARPYFLDLDANLGLHVHLEHRANVRIVWAQPIGGLPTPSAWTERALWIDYADTLPNAGSTQHPGTAAMLWGLHLSRDEAQAGALLAFPGEAQTLHAAVAHLIAPHDLPDLALAFAQCHRLAGPQGLAARQRAALTEAWRGLHEAAGLPMLPPADFSALAHGVAVRVPEECDAATFYAYVRGENTPVRWLPELRPLHYAAIRAGGAPAPATTAAHLARWLLAPVGPDFTAEEIGHTILGIVKASDYLGVRWYTNPARAAAYAALMNGWYGPDHDAYRPAFAIHLSAESGSW